MVCDYINNGGRMIVLIFAAFLCGYIYEDGDSLIIDNDTLTMCGLHQYQHKVNFRNGSILFVHAATGAPDSTGWIVLNAPQIIIENSSSVNGSRGGYKGAYMNSHPWGYGPGGGGAAGVSGGGGGGGAYGGNGGAGGDNYGGSGGVAYGDSADTLIQMGSGGAAGRLSVVDGAGGNGGASVTLRACIIDLDSSEVLVDGQRGVDGSVEAGGGGAGGGILLWSDTVRINGVMLNAQGGAGGDAPFGGGGGAGGGRIKILYSALLDTLALSTLIQGGNAGVGSYGNPQPGQPGTIYMGIQTTILEIVNGPDHCFVIQPNPTRGIVHLHATAVPFSIIVYDCAGRRAGIIEVTSEHATADLSDLKPGVYFLKSQDFGQRASKIVITQ